MKADESAEVDVDVRQLLRHDVVKNSHCLFCDIFGQRILQAIVQDGLFHLTCMRLRLRPLLMASASSSNWGCDFFSIVTRSVTELGRITALIALALGSAGTFRKARSPYQSSSSPTLRSVCRGTRSSCSSCPSRTRTVAARATSAGTKVLPGLSRQTTVCRPNCSRCRQGKSPLQSARSSLCSETWLPLIFDRLRYSLGDTAGYHSTCSSRASSSVRSAITISKRFCPLLGYVVVRIVLARAEILEEFQG